MNIRRIAIAMASATALLTGPAAAQPSAANLAANLYVGAAFGQSRAQEACSGVASCDERDNAFGAFAGYWFHPSFAAELGYHNLGKTSAAGGTYVRSNAWELLAVAAWRPRAPLALYGKLGPYRGAQEGGGALAGPKELVTAITYGVGAQLDVMKNAGLRVEWQNYPRMGGGPVLPRGDISVLRLGALWRFE